MKLIGIDAFRTAARAAAGAKEPGPQAGIYRVQIAQPKAFDDGSRRLRFCFSDGSVDRMGDTIDPAGWEIDDFMANPVALWAHDSLSPPIGRASDVGPEGTRLMGTVEFADLETYAFADTIYRLLLGRFLNAVSVGFLPTEYSFVENDPDRGWGIDFKRQSLLEISVCPVPANPHALVDARAKGINLRPLVEWVECTLDTDGMTVINKAELQKLRAAAKEIPMARRPGTRRRADDEPDDKPDEGEGKGTAVATCGRKATDECGMKDPSECAIHGGGQAAADDDPDKPDDEEKRLRRLLLRLLAPARRADDDTDPDPDVPLEHQDAIRVAHKSMRTCKAFMTEAMGHYAKGMSLLDGVVEALNGDTGTPASEDDVPDPDEKARHLRRAAELRSRIKPVA